MNKNNNNNNLAYAIPVVAIGALLAIIGTNEPAFATFPVQNLNTFISSNQSTGEPVLNVLGEFTNNGEQREDYVDLVVTFYDRSGKIIGVQNFYEDDIKPGDTISFNLQVPASAIKGGDLSNYNKIKVTGD